MAFGGLNIWRFDAWAGHTRTDDELKTAQRGPSPAVYLNRFGDVDVRAFGPSTGMCSLGLCGRTAAITASKICDTSAKLKPGPGNAIAPQGSLAKASP